jgi:hypothetical protein
LRWPDARPSNSSSSFTARRDPPEYVKRVLVACRGESVTAVGAAQNQKQGHA